ncbi:MarR family transcriptional regulator [Shewanella sp. VB17]|uniref:MarR family winged helix-turn-helix transcriptional regulator n=1 Tax=Shewanella sp. VB17 TaxID=2739432 RepID=UPI001565D2FF|nr:MarR family transcriptional regulator [Shewanella sp. VB17]NRD75024.1 MarR family transcriptional regulator [Shewanella sp. VB17]
MSTVKLDNQLCFALYSASSRLTSIYRSLLAPIDLTYTQFLVLLALGEEDNLSITFLSKKLGLTKATMSPLLKRLEYKQLIKRQVVQNNERQKNIQLTEMGQELVEKSEYITQQAFCATGLSKEQVTEVISLCRQILP